MSVTMYRIRWALTWLVILAFWAMGMWLGYEFGARHVKPPVIIRLPVEPPAPPKPPKIIKPKAPEVPVTVSSRQMGAGELAAWFEKWENCAGEHCID
jgi:hypothetical protein